MIDRIKYNKSKHQFMLIDNHRHYQTKNSRKEEILSIDSWLMDSDNRLVANFKDNNGRKYRNVPIDVKTCRHSSMEKVLAIGSHSYGFSLQSMEICA